VSKLLLVRHGHVEGIAPERFRGREDVPLSELGQRQARATAMRIAADWGASAVYTSPLQRCMQTGAAIASACNAPSRYLDDLVDLDYGTWQWRTFDDVRKQAPQEFATWLKTPEWTRFPQGESLSDLSARVTDALRWIRERHPTETVIVVGHDSGNRALLLQLLGLPLSAYWRLSQHPCGISEIDIAGNEVRILRVNETHHLRWALP